MRFAPDGTQLPDFVVESGLTRHGQLAIDAARNVYVSSWTDNVIDRYDQAGNYLGRFADFDSAGIEGPLGIAFDVFGQCYVSEYLNKRLVLLGPGGDRIGVVADFGGETEMVTIDRDGNIRVPMFFDGLVKKIDPAGNFFPPTVVTPGPYETVEGPASVEATSFRVVRGRLNSGGAEDLKEVDGNVLRVCRFIVPNTVVPPVEVELQGTTSVANPTEITFYVTSRMTISGLFSQELVMVQADGNLSPTVRRTDPLNTNMKTVSLRAEDGSGFVTSEGFVRARYLIRQTGPAASASWCHEADQASWTLIE
jgi:hypothetical protein